MAFEQVGGDISGNDRLVFLERLQVAVSLHLGRDLENRTCSSCRKLGLECRIVPVMAQRPPQIAPNSSP